MTDPLTPPPTDAEIRRRQHSRALAMAVVLVALVVLFFGISIAKMSK